MEDNLQLIEQAKNGDVQVMAWLWDQYKDGICRICSKWFYKNQKFAATQGQQLDDLKQSGFLALVYAVNHFDSNKGEFSACLFYAIKQAIRKTVYQGHIRYKEFEGKSVAVGADPLNGVISLDMQIETDKGEVASLGALLPNLQSEEELRAIDEKAYISNLRAVLIDAMQELSPKQKGVLRGLFYDKLPAETVAQYMGLSKEQVFTVRAMALGRLRKNPRLQRWYNNEFSCAAWHGTGLRAWKHHGSVEEVAVEQSEFEVCSTLCSIHY